MNARHILSRLKILWPAILIPVVIFIFFRQLFFPLSIFITPDYGRSDVWHFSLANKYYLAGELKQNRLPFWNPKIGTGFPTLAEGQSGIFFIPNLVLFRLFPFAAAYNLTLVFAFITAGVGTYLFCRSLTLTKSASLLAGVIFPLGGFFMVHVQHHNLLQTASITPLLFWTTNEFLKNRRVIFLLALSALLSQQIFAGFPQITFYSLAAIAGFISIKIFTEKLKIGKTLAPFAIFVILAMFLSAVQLLPSFELLKLSTRQKIPQDILGQFPYKPKNLLQFLNPFALGTPQDGSYPKWQAGKWGVYWESVAYVGVMPISLALAVLLVGRKPALIFGILAFVSILLSLGASSPLHPVFSIAPFSLFRVPSRFLLITQFSLAILAAIYISRVERRKYLLFLIIAASTLDLFYKFQNYNPTDKADRWFSPPQTADWLAENQHGRIYSIGQAEKWNEHFFEGWQNTNYYYFARNSLDQNSNLIFNLDSLLAYESLVPERSGMLQYTLLQQGVRGKDGFLKFEDYAITLLKNQNVTHILTPFEIENDNFEKKFQTENFDNISFKIYEIKGAGSRFYVTSKYEVAQTIPRIISKITQKPAGRNAAILEKEPSRTSLTVKNWQAETVLEKSTHLEFSLSLDGDGLFVISDSYYPGWKAYLDGKEAEIYAANINSRAVIIPEGNHKLTFKFQSKTIKFGSYLSILGYSALAIAFLKFGKARIG